MCVWSDRCPHPLRATTGATLETHIHSSITSLPSSIFHSSFPPSARWLEVMTSVVLHKVTRVCLPAFLSPGYILFTNRHYRFRRWFRVGKPTWHLTKIKWEGGYWKPPISLCCTAPAIITNVCRLRSHEGKIVNRKSLRSFSWLIRRDLKVKCVEFRMDHWQKCNMFSLVYNHLSSFISA